MRHKGATLLLLAWSVSSALLAQDLTERVRVLEGAGNALAARRLLTETVREERESVSALQTYAEFLDRHGDAAARSVYGRLVDEGKLSGAALVNATRRLVVLDLLAGDHADAARRLEQFRRAGGSGFFDIPARAPRRAASQFVEIPGPIASFARMAAFSPDLPADSVLPALARNVITSGYRISASYEGLQPTEYMKLLGRYLSQARELEKLTDDKGILRIETCDSPKTADLLRILGYRMRGGCGAEVILETLNATRAFLTIDAGFPLAELETALRTDRPFEYDFSPARLPVLYSGDFWIPEKGKKRYPAFIDAFLADPALCRLYLAFAKMDRATADALKSRASVEKLKAFAHVLDFFGAWFELRDGVAVTPGNERSAAVWEKLVGVPPRKGAEFYEALIARDDGWMASYYDALRRIHGPVLNYLTAPARLERFYLAIRGRVTSPGPARPVFRSNADLMLLTTRLRLDPDGTPHLPGNLDVWRRLFYDSPDEVYDGYLKKAAASWKEKDDVIEALFALCRKPVENEPLKIYTTLSDIDRARSTPLAPETVDRLARVWHRYGDQYPLFTETGALSDATILAYVETARGIDDIGDRLLRADTAGVMQSLVGIWQISVRNGVIAESQADAVLSGILSQFGKLGHRRDLFDRGRVTIEMLAKATGGGGKDSLQDHFIDVLAGAVSSTDTESYQRVTDYMRRIFAAQRLLSLDLIFDAADEFAAVADGKQLDTALVNRLATRLEEIEPNREGLSRAEKNAISFGYWSERHLSQQRKLDVRKEVRKASRSPEKMRNLRGQLAVLLRDTLVGYNYLHYAPPGAQLLRTNPMFVRGHDFLGAAGANEMWHEAEVFGAGWPSSAGGRLVGSLAGLPYALAQAEQNFLIPRNEQALIWGDLVPQLIMSAKVPRWWNTEPALQQWVALHIRLARTALAESALDANLRSRLIEGLSAHATPARTREVSRLLEAGDVVEALDNVTPAELFMLGRVLAAAEPNANLLAREIERLHRENPARVNYDAVSRAYGSPKPKLAHSYRPELLNLPTFPTLMGYSSRIMAESFESSLLYYATLADDLYLRPSQLNVQVPVWTQQTVETIFATHLEDWPAVLRSLREVGDEARATSRRNVEPVEQAAAVPQ